MAALKGMSEIISELKKQNENEPSPKITKLEIVFMEILHLLRTNIEESKKQAEIERAFQEERDYEDEKRHQEFIDVLKQFLALKPEKVEEEKKEDSKSFLEKLKDFFSNLSENFKKVLEKLVSVLNVVRLLSMGFGTVGAIVVGIYAASKLLQYFVDKMPDLSIINPQQASGVLEYGNQQQIEYFASKIPKEFVDKLKKETGKTSIPPRELLEQFVRFGGLVPVTEPAQVPNVPPRPTEAGFGARARDWDRRFGATHNPDGTPKNAGGARAFIGSQSSAEGAGRGSGEIQYTDTLARQLESTGQTGAVFGRYPSSGAGRRTTPASPTATAVPATTASTTPPTAVPATTTGTATPTAVPATTAGTTPSPAATAMPTGNIAPDLTQPATTPQGATAAPTPTAPPVIVPSINPLNRMLNDATILNNELLLRNIFDTGDIISSVNNTGQTKVLPDSPMSVEASQRDDTPILAHVLKRYKQVYV